MSETLPADATQQSLACQAYTCPHVLQLVELKKENRQLKRNLQEAEAKQADVINRFTADAEIMFQQAAERQSRIDALEKQLSLVRHALLDTTYAKPSSIALKQSCANSTNDLLKEEELLSVVKAENIPSQAINFVHGNDMTETALLSPPKSDVLKELSSNTGVSGFRDVHPMKKRKLRNATPKAIAAIAEDGGNLVKSENAVEFVSPSSRISVSSKSSLKVLMSTPVLSSKPLQTQHRTPRSPHVPTATGAYPFRNTIKSAQNAGDPLYSPKDEVCGMATTASSYEKGDHRRALHPGYLSEQKLHVFEQTSNAGGIDHADRKTFDGRQTGQCTSIIPEIDFHGSSENIHPNLSTSSSSLRPPSDDGILLRFPEPGSEQPIRRLMTSTRMEIPHDAGSDTAMEEFKKLRKHPERRRQSPTGFWKTDFAGSQEEKVDS